MRDEEQGGHRWERVRGKHSRRCAPATGGVPMPKMRCIDRKVRAESRSSEQTNLGSSTCHGLPCGFAVITKVITSRILGLGLGPNPSDSERPLSSSD